MFGTGKKQRLASAKLHRIGSLIRKEARQIVRDPSSIAMGIVLPVLLILLFGYGLSLDVTEVPVARRPRRFITCGDRIGCQFSVVALFRRPVDDLYDARSGTHAVA